MFAARRALSSRYFLAPARNCVIRESRASYVRGHWPEPITQQTLDEFLNEINYFEEPKDFINIGLKLDAVQDDQVKKSSKKVDSEESEVPAAVDEILTKLGVEAEQPELDLDDANIDERQLMRLAVSFGIFRDLFGDYNPNYDHIKFTHKQAERLYSLVPHYWITDQPFARVERHQRKLDPIYYFEPVVGISARFVQSLGKPDQDEKYCHSAYHGNVIPACEAKVKPSIAIDGRKLCSLSSEVRIIQESQFNNWQPGSVSMVNFGSKMHDNYYSVILLNLDSMHTKSANLHWMVANISRSISGEDVTFEEVCDYLPVHGIKGFGYSRYVFLVVQHKGPLDVSYYKFKDFKPETRKFDVRAFLNQNAEKGLVPVGLSWFQTTWDESSNEVFHRFMDIRSPVYEHVQQALEKRQHLNKSYPGKVPFHIFMDHYRDKKESNERVLLERLKHVDPFDYKDQYVKPKVPPTVFQDEDVPSWMNTVLFKKKNRIGVWRGLRPASATIPLNNNADLDYPERPHLPTSKVLPKLPNLYPVIRKKKLLKDLPYSKPVNEYTNVYVDPGSENQIEQVKRIMQDLNDEKKQV